MNGYVFMSKYYKDNKYIKYGDRSISKVIKEDK